MVRRRKRSNTLAAPGTPKAADYAGPVVPVTTWNALAWMMRLECESLRIPNTRLIIVELLEIPGIVTDQPVTSLPGVDDLFYRLRRDRQRKVPYIGYPVRVKWRKSAKWEG